MDFPKTMETSVDPGENDFLNSKTCSEGQECANLKT